LGVNTSDGWIKETLSFDGISRPTRGNSLKVELAQRIGGGNYHRYFLFENYDKEEERRNKAGVELR
jgi:hypothetical protein